MHPDEVMAMLSAKPSVEELQLSIDEIKSEIEALDSYLATSRVRDLINIITKSGAYKGEIKNLSLKQFRDLLGYEAPKAVRTDHHVPWEYALDQLATERGYKSSDDLKEAIERAGADSQ